MNLDLKSLKQALAGRREFVIWKNLLGTCVAVVGDKATIIVYPGETFEYVPLAEIQPRQPGDEYVDHCNRIIVVKAAATLDPAWLDKGLIRDGWNAYIEGSRDDSDGFPVDPLDPNCWRAFVGGYMVSDEPVVETAGGSSRTYLVYLSPREYVQRLAQRAFDLWIPEMEDKRERDKDSQIRALLRKMQALKIENERLWERLGYK